MRKTMSRGLRLQRRPEPRLIVYSLDMSLIDKADYTGYNIRADRKINAKA